MARRADKPSSKATGKPPTAGEASAKRWAAAKAAESASGKRPKPLRPAAASQPTGKPQPSPEAMARAQALLRPPPAPWHPLPLAEIAIVVGFLAILLAAVLTDRDGILAGFLLIMLGTAEFSWREHRHGYRPHATVLALMLGVIVGGVLWRAAGLNRNACVVVGLVVFLFAWGILDREYVPAAKRATAADEDPVDPKA